ncbi:MAG TPA: Gfo/Idh/MocA family oxidoreductase [Candidatus Limnocylindrales bacterium]|nr:Gfo/Idh/MocA family oxidoreductase [Candidatus Limnocylindrales bacterium]
MASPGAGHRLRIGLVGAGLMGRLHARALAALPDVQLVAAAEPDTASARALLDIVPDARIHAGHEQLLAEGSLDAVIVATPETAHREPVVAALLRGLPVLVEKPMAVEAEDGEAMLAAAERGGASLMVGYILRFEPAYAALHAAVESGTFGRPVAIYARRCATIQEARRLGGRVSALVYLGVHDFDQVLWHHPVAVRRVSVRAARGRVWQELGTPDTIWTTIDFEDGAVAVVESGWGLPEGWGGWQGRGGWSAFGDVRYDLTGTSGFGSIDLRQMNLLGVDDQGWMFPETRHWPEVAGVPAGALHTQLEHFVDCVRTGRRPLVDGEQGLAVTRLLTMATRALAEELAMPAGRADDLALPAEARAP